jgi:ureidoacrylate peracid hydrolase
MKHSVLLVIDAQNIYGTPDSPLYIPTLETSIVNINALTHAYSEAGKPVIYMRHVHRADGRDAGRMFDFGGVAEAVSFIEDQAESAYVPQLQIVPGALHMTKHRYSCFAGTELEAVLRTLGADTVTICGYMTNFCCESTARAAHDRDYFVDFIADATGAPALGGEMTESRIIAGTTATLAAGFAQIYSTADYIERMA